MKTILKVLVGSQAHGLADETSDYDYRGVFLAPTSDILKIRSKIKNTHWVEGKTDDTAWELEHFLDMATRGNPTIMEVFHAPIVEADSLGTALRTLFLSVVDVKMLIKSHVGYGLNQRKKFLEDKDGRKSKYASAYLRTLYQCFTFLKTNIYPVNMVGTPIYETLLRYRRGDYDYGEVINTCLQWQQKIEDTPWAGIDRGADMNAVNDFLLTVRKENW